jgi:hypothetical protein
MIKVLDAAIADRTMACPWRLEDVAGRTVFEKYSLWYDLVWICDIFAEKQLGVEFVGDVFYLYLATFCF